MAAWIDNYFEIIKEIRGCKRFSSPENELEIRKMGEDIIEESNRIENIKHINDYIENDQKGLTTLGQIADYIENNKKYTLVYTNQVNRNDEQTTLLIDEDKKIVSTFYNNGYAEGLSADELKGILNFLGIKYFECVYNKIPENYFKEYKKYDWRSGNEIL